VNLRAAGVAGITLAAGLTLFVAARGPFRGLVGDVLVVVFLVAALAAVGLGSPRSRLVGVGVLSVGLELLQGLHLVGPESPWILHLVLGSTFDPLDLAAYAVGLALAHALERWFWSR
jgi:hypothetical protein